MLPIAFLTGPVPWLVLVALTVFFLWVDLRFFARGREPDFREGVIWSIGWLIVALLAAVVVVLLSNLEDGITFTTVYFIERSLSLDNLFVFLLLFAYFSIPEQHRANLLFWGIVLALVQRGVAIFAGVELIERFHIVIYVLGALLIVLAVRIYRGAGENVEPDKNLVVRGVRRVFPVTTDFNGHHWFARVDGKRYATPIFICLAAIAAADIAFAVDSIPAAFGITRDSTLIWMGNIFALLGLRALFVLVEGLILRFRYLDQTIAVVLGIVGVKLLIEDILYIAPLPSLGIIVVCFAVGIGLSVLADRRDPDSERKRAVREEKTEAGHNPDVHDLQEDEPQEAGEASASQKGD